MGAAKCLPQVNGYLAHWISQLARCADTVGALTDHLSPEVVPAAVFLLFDLFVFMLRVFGRKCSRHACLLFLPVVDEADKEPSR